ncbi:MAG: restriction endonuclease subunit S [Chloroflexi bacterium]|nr:restriction endonuclease subunit S [Chloroflexota bacterium]
MKWSDKKLGAICEEFGGLIQTGPFGSQLHQSEYQDEGVPFIMPQDIEDGRIKLDSVARVSEEAANRLKRHKVKLGTIVMPRRGAINKRAFITEIEEGALCGSGCIKIELSGVGLHPKFLYHYLDQPNIVAWIEQHAVGSTMLNLNSTIIQAIPVRYPDFGVQEKIASVLSAYDDLIENNRRRMTLLEESARQLYREWFVRLRFPGYEHTRIVKGVPEGWAKKKMRDVCESVGGGTPSTSRPEFWEDGDITWVVPTDITRNNCLALLDSEKKITEAGLKNSSAKMVPPETILMTSRASIGFFGLVDRVVCTNQGFISVIPKEENLRMYLLHNLMNRREEILGRAVGSTYKEISKSTFREMDILVPTHSLLESFSEFAYDTFRQVRVLKKQEVKLRAARDLLLPRLMSGEIAV